MQRRCKGAAAKFGRHRPVTGETPPFYARFRRPHVLHMDVGELALHTTLLNLKLAWLLVYPAFDASLVLRFQCGMVRMQTWGQGCLKHGCIADGEAFTKTFQDVYFLASVPKRFTMSFQR